MEVIIKLFLWISGHNKMVGRLHPVLRRRWERYCANQRFKQSLHQKIHGDVKSADRNINRQQRPVILFSACRSQKEGGEYYKYNGGGKLANLWIKLLRSHGYEAYMVTYSGNYQPWLIEHQPHVSLATVRQWQRERRHLKYVTGWVPATAFINLADELYFIDAEIAYTTGPHLRGLRKLLKSKIRAVATNSRTEQAWYMAKFNRNVALIQDWCDESYWYPMPEKRQKGRVGYMGEGPESEAEIKKIADICHQRGVNLEFVRVAGDEAEVLEAMRRCDYFLGMNPGKHVLWGEGSPRSPQEAMHCGCVVVAYDVFGNREYLIDGFSGFLAPRQRPDIMADLLVRMERNLALKEKVRASAIELAARAFTSRARWKELRDFLELEDLEIPADDLTGGHAPYALKKADLMRHLGATAHMTEEEIFTLARYASLAPGTLVEIGAAHGGSAVILLSNGPSSVAVHSIDPFVRDSHGPFQASAGICRRNVRRALKSMKIPQAIDRWHLHELPSYDLAPGWNEPVGFLFIDGDHTYQAVRRDFNDWFPYVCSGGWVLLHDSRRVDGTPGGVHNQGWPGPTQLARELKELPDIELVDEAGSLTVWRRR